MIFPNQSLNNSHGHAPLEPRKPGRNKKGPAEPGLIQERIASCVSIVSEIRLDSDNFR
ncbi:hypothetical protein L21SP2_1674 [Salinispira pacifica]|uniref:Uncharacterized protein n=1 Tax=Salinispira pacifica TaxID=1307761 RepID=V5WGW8_9SPIO|nr:hypothetical protein L21SP2_1674 [Salinispira pacifica]